MNRLFLILFLCNVFAGRAQTDTIYEAFVADAGLFHLQKDYKKAIANYEMAFTRQQPNALAAYKAAGAYALSNNPGKTYQYLSLALQKGWTDSNALDLDPYFDNIRLTDTQGWQQILDKSIAKELAYGLTLKFPSVRKQINIMALADQQLRYLKAQSKSASEIAGIDKDIESIDRKNLGEAKAILNNYGWPKISEIGHDGQHNFWLLVQHADHDVSFQMKALAEMEKWKDTKEISLEDYAFLFDRVQCNLNYKQVYGTQVMWTQNGRASGFRPIAKEDQVDQRRKSLGLLPLHFYAMNYGFSYQPITSAQATTNERSDIAYAQKQIASAQADYGAQQYAQAYAAYNNASMVMSGMTNDQNYDAAVLFAKIYQVTNDQKYKSIALDFLNLLFLRDELASRNFGSQKEFESFQTDARWLDLTKK